MHKGNDLSCGGPGTYNDATAYPRSSEYERKRSDKRNDNSTSNGNSGGGGKYGPSIPPIPSHAHARLILVCALPDTSSFLLSSLPSPVRRAQRLKSARRLLVPISFSARPSCEVTGACTTRWERHGHSLPHCSGHPVRRGQRGSQRRRRRSSRRYPGHGLRPGRGPARVPQGIGGRGNASHINYFRLNRGVGSP